MLPHTRPQVVEWKATVPANSSLVFTARYRLALFAVDRLPADSSRGLEIEGAEVAFSLADGGGVGRVFTDGVIVALMLPDLSMPYNVISISSTLLALFVGSMVNLLSRATTPRWMEMETWRDAVERRRA